MRVAVLALLAGCGFHIPAGSVVDDATSTDDANSGDGGVADAPVDVLLPDTPVIEVDECEVVPTGPTAFGALLGGTGQRAGVVACDDDKVAVGLQFDVTPQGIANHGDHILMTTIRLWCGNIARTETNQIVTSNLSVSSYTALVGSSPTACNAYTPPTALAEVMCPQGSVLVAIAGHQVDSTLYNDVAIRCAAVQADGQVSNSLVTIAMPGTGMNQTMPEATFCPASTVITSITATSGCGQDGATVSCRATVCTEKKGK
jgi:hypothetical protein